MRTFVTGGAGLIGGHIVDAVLGGMRGWEGDVPVVRFDLDKIHRLGVAKLNSRLAVERSIVELLKGGMRGL